MSPRVRTPRSNLWPSCVILPAREPIYKVTQVLGRRGGLGEKRV